MSVARPGKSPSELLAKLEQAQASGRAVALGVSEALDPNLEEAASWVKKKQREKWAGTWTAAMLEKK